MTWRADPAAAALADRHYSRKTPGADQFTPPGQVLCLMTDDRLAVWASSWPKAEYVMHAWAGAWMNTLFRNEGGGLASELILEAVAATRWRWPEVPELGMISMVDPRHVPPTRRRGRDIFGYSYLKAGFRHVGHTKAGQWVWQMTEDRMPSAAIPHGAQAELLA